MASVSKSSPFNINHEFVPYLCNTGCTQKKKKLIRTNFCKGGWEGNVVNRIVSTRRTSHDGKLFT